MIVFVPTPTISFKWDQPRLIVQPFTAFLKCGAKVAKTEMTDHTSKGHKNSKAMQKEHSRIDRLLDTDVLA